MKDDPYVSMSVINTITDSIKSAIQLHRNVHTLVLGIEELLDEVGEVLEEIWRAHAMSQQMSFVALARKVLVAAVLNAEVGDWCAYIDAVPGQNHQAEYPEVARHGDKIPEWMARQLFGNLLERVDAQRVAADMKPMLWRD